MGAIAEVQSTWTATVDPVVRSAGLDACPEAIAIEAAGRIAYANLAFTRIFSADEFGFLGRTIDDLNAARKAKSPDARISRKRFKANGREYELLTVADPPLPALSSVELRRSQKLEAIGRLVGSVVHDFNNLLTGVVLCCDLLLAKLEKDSPLRRYAQEMRSAGAQGAVLIEQLMAVVRQNQVEPAVLSWNEVIADMQNLLTRLVGENIELKAKLAGSLQRIEMDASGAQQIILNLVLNARDAMPDGGQISLSTRNCVPVPHLGEHSGTHDTATTWAELEVADTGRGMDEETRVRMFEAFFTTKENGHGTGLATVKSIVSEYHGTIDVDSQPGLGTRIRVAFPGVSDGRTGNFQPERGITR